MGKKKKVLKIIVSVAVSIAIVFGAAAYFLFLHRYKGSKIDAPWSESDAVNISDIPSLQKRKGEPFVILNLADVQLCDLEDLFTMHELKAEIAALIEKARPDLITLTGDQTWSNENLISLTSIVSWLDEFQIPYAPVFGNHDCGNETDNAVLSRAACCDVYEKGKYSLFKRGPDNLGTLGNYVVNVEEGGEIVRALYFIDSSISEQISDEQIAWLKWNAEGIRAARGGEYADSACFFHLPLPEYSKAYYAYLAGEGGAEAIGDVYVTYSLYGSMQNGFFEQAKSVGVKDVVCGHQHGNCFTIKYDGVRLTFALKTGTRGGYYSGDGVTLDGATIISFDGEMTDITLVFAD